MNYYNVFHRQHSFRYESEYFGFWFLLFVYHLISKSCDDDYTENEYRICYELSYVASSYERDSNNYIEDDTVYYTFYIDDTGCIRSLDGTINYLYNKDFMTYEDVVNGFCKYLREVIESDDFKNKITKRLEEKVIQLLLRLGRKLKLESDEVPF